MKPTVHIVNGLTCDLLHKGHEDAVRADHATLHQLPHQPHQLKGERRARSLVNHLLIRKHPHVYCVNKANCIESTETVSAFSTWRQTVDLCAAHVLQLEELLHEDLVDLDQDHVHAVPIHQGQVSVALWRLESNTVD